MSHLLSICWQYARAFVLIYLCLFAGNALAALLPFELPGCIIGMLILFILLASQIMPASWVKPGCSLFIRYMALLFVPIGVGIMQYYDVLCRQFGPIVIACVVSTLIIMVVVAYCSHLMHRERPDEDEQPVSHPQESKQ